MYSPGALKAAFTAAWPFTSGCLGWLIVTVPGPRYFDHSTVMPIGVSVSLFRPRRLGSPSSVAETLREALAPLATVCIGGWAATPRRGVWLFRALVPPPVRRRPP